MATASPHQLSSHFTAGPDYEALWNKLEKQILEIRQNTSDAICVEDNSDKAKILRGTWGAYGFIYNTMLKLKSGETTES